MQVTFDEDDWDGLTAAQKRAIRSLAKALFDFEPMATMHSLGHRGIGDLIAKGLAEAGPSSRPAIAETGYRLTAKGWLANEWCDGNWMGEA